jgi:hypothetical protein
VDADNAQPTSELPLKEDKKSGFDSVSDKKTTDVIAKADPVESIEIDQREKSGVASFDELGGRTLRI